MTLSITREVLQPQVSQYSKKSTSEKRFSSAGEMTEDLSQLKKDGELPIENLHVLRINLSCSTLCI